MKYFFIYITYHMNFSCEHILKTIHALVSTVHWQDRVYGCYSELLSFSAWYICKGKAQSIQYSSPPPNRLGTRKVDALGVHDAGIVHNSLSYILVVLCYWETWKLYDWFVQYHWGSSWEAPYYLYFQHRIPRVTFLSGIKVKQGYVV